MTRITPRTCLWPLAGSLSLTFGLSIGLTFRSDHHCYAGTCGEWLFPLQARLHILVWYCWLGISVTILAIRAFHPRMQKFLRRPLVSWQLPVIGKQPAISGILVLFWIISLYGILIGVWWVRLDDYFTQRGIEGGVLSGNKILAAIALTGHLCDVTMGMAILPISRHSALASFFKISVATTLTFHMITAYTLFGLVLTHGLLYVSWIPVFEALPTALRRVYPVLNPTYLYHETWPGNHTSLGIWRASLIFTGMLAASIMLLIFITTLPAIRTRHFNLFYFTHLLGIVAVIIICLHASTMLYCTAPGLAMWLLDWAMRLYELWAPLDGNISSFGNEWYCLSVPLPRRRLDGCSCSSPLAHFYIHHSDSSIRELHPFTTITHLATQDKITDSSHDDIDIQFLFRKQGVIAPAVAPEAKRGFAQAMFGMLRQIRRQRPESQWTNRLAGLAVEHNSMADARGIPVSLRLEGPYFTPADPKRYRTVVCLVAGTGISGALAIAGMFQEIERQASSSASDGRHLGEKTDGGGQASVLANEKSSSVQTLSQTRVWSRCIVVWSVREDCFVDLPGLQNSPNSALDVRIHLTGSGRPRLSASSALDDILSDETRTDSRESGPSMWVYISGPNAFITAGEAACSQRQARGVEWYGAKWEV